MFYFPPFVTLFTVVNISGGGMKKLNRRGRRRRVRCNSDADCQEGQTCKERRHGGRKHHSVGAGVASMQLIHHHYRLMG
ncbi:unnamed protein product [Heterobilharzia americana]|nr:unnamed protein product [Heterobilharzia americana]